MPLDALLLQRTHQLVRARQTQVIGPKIKECREARGMSQYQLAEAIRVGSQTVSNWERGKYSPDFANLEILARVLGKSPAYFLKTPGETEDGEVSPEEAESMAQRLERAVEGIEKLTGVVDRLAEVVESLQQSPPASRRPRKAQ